MKTEVIANQKGGTAKSITAYNQAHYLSKIRNKRVIFIDSDEQGSSSSSLVSFHTDLQASDFFLGKKIVLPENRNFVVAKADSQGLKEASNMISDKEQSKLVENLRRSLGSIKEEFDWCVIDTPGSNGVIAGASLFVADYVLIPSIIDNYSLPIAITMLKRVLAIQKIHEKHNRELTNLKHHRKLVNLGILPTLFDTMSPTQKKDLEMFLEQANQFVIRAKISKRSAYPQAASSGIPIFDLKTTSGREASKEMINAFNLIATKMEM